MKNKLIFIILLCLLILVPIKTNAASVNVSLSCPSSANAGEIINCKVNISSDVNVVGVKAKYSLSGMTWVGFTPASGFTISDSSASGFLVQNLNNSSKSFTVGTIKVKVNSQGSLTLTNITASDTNDALLTSSNKTASIRIKSQNNNLGSLSLSNGALTPTFNANTTSYSATINASNVTINATKGDNYQTISGTGTKNLNYGNNKFNIVVTSESGAKKTYTINITRPDNRSNNNNLKSLSIDKGNISFNKNTLNYNVNVDSNVTSIKVDASIEDSKASFVSGYNPRTVNLNYGNNAIQIKVKAENQSIKTYTINVNRKDTRSNNNYLNNITIDQGNISFDKNTLVYNTSVAFEVTKINVVANPEDSKSKVVVNSPNLNVGDNVITITVTAENGQNRVYKINVKRLEKAIQLSDNNNVTSLRVLGHNIDFKNDVLEYNLTIKDEYALVFEVVLEHPKATYHITGNEDLKNNSVITLKVTSESGKVKEYKFNISKEVADVKEPAKEETTSNGLIYGGIGFVIGCIVTFVITSLFKKKKDNTQITN